MPLHGRTRQAGRGLVVVIGAAATITPMVVWHVASNDVGRLVEAACQFLVVVAVLAHILRWRAVTRWLDRAGLGRDDPPDVPPASPSTIPTKGSTMATRNVPAETPGQPLPPESPGSPDQGFNPDSPDQGFNPDAPDQGFNPDHPDQGFNPDAPDQGFNPDSPGQGLPGDPGAPGQGLPGNPDAPGQGLPPGSPGSPDQSLPVDPDAYPDQGLPPGVEVAPPTGGTPDNTLPVPPITGGPSTPKGRWVFIPKDLTDKYTVKVSLESK